MTRCPRCHVRLSLDGECQAHGRPTAVGPVAVDHRTTVQAPAGFSLGDLLAEGATSSVYVVRETGTERLAVMKRARRADAETLVRFAMEIEVLRALGAPITPTYLADGLERGSPYILMERVPGETLATRMAREPRRDVAILCDELRAVLRSLAALHRAGYVHRDLKPENIMMTTAEARLIDLGLARPLQGGRRVTQIGHVAGTTHYQAPEQIRVGGVVDQRADLYAFGVVAFELLAGRPPFVGERSAIEYQHQMVVPPLVSELRDVPPEVAAVIAACLAKHPEARPASAEVVLARLAPPAPDDGPTLPDGARPPASTVPVVLLTVVGGEPVVVSRAIADAQGTVLRHHERGILAAFVVAEHEHALHAATNLARTIVSDAHGHVVVHVTNALVRRTAERRIVVYGPDVADVASWMPKGAFDGVVLTAAAAAQLDGAVPAPDVASFFRAREDHELGAISWVSPRTFVGRQRLLEEIERALEAPGACVVVSGAQGSGTSRLLVELAARLRANQREVALVQPRRRFPGEAADDQRVTEVLATGTAEGAPILLVDDADRLSRRLGARLLGPLAQRRVLVTKGSSELAGDPTLRIELVPLLPRDAAALVRELLLPARLVPDVLVERVVLRSTGNPGLLVALARDLRHRGGLRRQPGSHEWYVAADHHDTLLAPPELAWLALRAVEDLPQEIAHVVRGCAALGPRFASDEVVHALDRPSVASALEWLVARDMFTLRTSWYSFSSAALQDAVYAGLSDTERRRLHARGLQFWQGREIKPAVGWLARVGFHAAGCHQRDLAMASWLTLGRAALRRGDSDQADDLLARAAQLVASDHPAIARTLEEDDPRVRKSDGISGSSNVRPRW